MSKDAPKSPERKKLELSERMDKLAFEVRARIFPYDQRRIERLKEILTQGEEMGIETSRYRELILTLEEIWPKNDLRDYVDNMCRVLETNEAGIDELMKRVEGDADKIYSDEIPLNKIQEKLSFFIESLKGIISLIDDFLKNLRVRIESAKERMDTVKYEDLLPVLEEKRRKFNALKEDCAALLNQLQNKASGDNSNAA